jgi:hypothetical protein
VKIPAQCFVLGFAALACFLEAFLAPRGSDPGPALTAVMGLLLVRRNNLGTGSCDERGNSGTDGTFPCFFQEMGNVPSVPGLFDLWILLALP